MKWCIRLLPLISQFLVLSSSGSPQLSERKLADSAKPYFAIVNISVAHRKQEGRAIYNQGAFACNGYSTVTLIPDGRIFMVWCASIGFARGCRLVGSFSNDGSRTWSEAIELINNPDRDDADPSIIIDGTRLVVISLSIRMPEKWDKFNPFPVRWDRSWWYMTESNDDGKTWSTPIEVTRPYHWAGKRCNGIRLKDGTLLLPYYYLYGSEVGNIPKLEEGARSDAGVVRSTDGGRTWTSGQIMKNCGADNCAEPAAVLLSNGELYCLMRTMTDHLYESRSRDYGLTWDVPKPSPIVSGKNVPFAVHRLENGRRDELVAAWNYPDRLSLVASYSSDGGKSWTAPKLVVRPNPKAQYWAYNPCICQTKDGLILVAWQQETLPRHLGNELRIARFNRAWLVSK